VAWYSSYSRSNARIMSAGLLPRRLVACGIRNRPWIANR
jgi:hypothetical protein